MTCAAWIPLRVAWDEALYGEGGFYRHSEPVDHFRTSTQVSVPFAEAVVTFAQQLGVASICDVGAGNGGLLNAVHQLDHRLSLTGVDLRGRPAGLAETIGWQPGLPVGHRGLVLANELLDNIPCDVVEAGDRDGFHLVEVDRHTGAERLGPPATEVQRTWLDRWWPLNAPGERAEVGLAREAFWTTVLRENPAAHCVAIDYGHLRAQRPPGGSLASYRRGVQTTVTFDGRHDVTAHVAFDSLAAAVGGTLRHQRDVLLGLGMSGLRPPISQATADPSAYLRGLARATHVAELTALEGLGVFWWLATPPRQPVLPDPAAEPM